MFRKLIRWILLFSLLSLCFGVSFWLVFTRTLHSGRIRVPDVVGQTLDEAETLLKEKELKLVLDATMATQSDAVPTGTVSVQDPKGGRVVIQGSEVRIGISLGTPQIAVPNLVTRTVQEAKFLLVKQQLKVESIAQMPFSGEPGTIVAQFPPAGVLVCRNRGVHLLLASPTPPYAYIMPNCLGKMYGKVRTAFESRGFTIAGIREKTVSHYPNNMILHQFPPPGHPVRPGDVVSFTVNREETHG